MADKKNANSVEKLIVKKITDSIATLDGISKIVKVGIDKEKELYIVSVKLKVFYGVNIPTLSYDIQTLGKNALLEEELNLIKSINISVEGIDNQVK